MHIHATVTIHRSQERTSKSYGIDRRILIARRTVKSRKRCWYYRRYLFIRSIWGPIDTLSRHAAWVRDRLDARGSLATRPRRPRDARKRLDAARARGGRFAGIEGEHNSERARVHHRRHDDPFICGLFLLFSSDRAPTRDTLHTLYPACTGLTCVSEYTSRPKWPLHWCSTLVRPGPAARPCGRKSTCASYSVAAGAAADG